MKLILGICNIGQDSKYNDITTIETYEYLKDLINENKVEILSIAESVIECDNLQKTSIYLQKNTNLKYCEDFKFGKACKTPDAFDGITISSKYEIENNERYLLPNPKLTYKKSEDITYVTYDKGFNITTFKEFKDFVIISGAGFPFHIFNTTSPENMWVYEEIENKVIEFIKLGKKVVFMGDFNYYIVYDIFPRLKQLTNNAYDEEMRVKIGQSDYFLLSKNIKLNNYKIIETRLDHKFCLIEIEI